MTKTKEISFKVDGRTFTSLEKGKQFVRETLASIGLCDSVKAIDMAKYELLLQITSHHPDNENKLAKVDDFMITYNALNKYKPSYALFIKNIDGSITDISWLCCVSGKHKSNTQNLNSAEGKHSTTD